FESLGERHPPQNHRPRDPSPSASSGSGFRLRTPARLHLARSQPALSDSERREEESNGPAGRLKFIIGAESGGGRRVPKTFFCCWCGYACERDRFLCSFHGGVRAVWRPAVRAIAGGKGYARSSGEGSEQASTGRYPARY